jgi:hypothetical protein
MINTITQDGTLHWTCAGEECQAQLSTPVTDLDYILSPDCDGPHGATIALPPCKGCGTQCFLKADYSLKELFKLTHTVVDPMGNIKGYAIPLRHVRNLLAHHLLYKEGKAAHSPVLPLPGEGFLEHPAMEALKSAPDVAYSLWFAWAMLKERGQMIEGFDQFFLGIAKPVPAVLGSEVS